MKPGESSMLAALRAIYEDDLDGLEARVASEEVRKSPSGYQATRLKLLKELVQELKTKRENDNGKEKGTE